MRPPVPTITPMRLSRFATLWDCTGEVVIDPESPRLKLLYEPLATLAPEDAEPYCCYLSTIIFYERGTRKEITRVNHYDLAAAPAPHLVNVYDRWFEATPRQVVWRAGWHMTYTLDDRTRAARFANLGSACLRQWEQDEANNARQLSHHSASGR